MADVELFNMDCLEAMREMPDGAYDLAIVDPPYGGGGYQQMMLSVASEDASAVRSTAISATPIRTTRGGQV